MTHEQPLNCARRNRLGVGIVFAGINSLPAGNNLS